MDRDGLGRFGEPAVLILASLAGGDKHGYALIKDIEAFSGVSMGPGTLYGALARLEERGMVKPLPSDDRRRPYCLTAAGVEALQSYLQHANSVVAVGLRRLAVT